MSLKYSDLPTIKRVKAPKPGSCGGCIFNNAKGRNEVTDDLSCITAECTGGVDYKALLHYIFVPIEFPSKRA